MSLTSVWSVRAPRVKCPHNFGHGVCVYVCVCVGACLRVCVCVSAPGFQRHFVLRKIETINQALLVSAA